MYYIELTGVKVFACHGVLPHEKVEGQQFLIDARLSVAVNPANLEDDIDKTVSYAEINNIIIEKAQEGPYNLIETLAYLIGWEILDRFCAVEWAEICVHKPCAPMKGAFDDVAVRYRLSR